MNKKKLTLSTLQVNSFVTNVDNNSKIKAGISGGLACGAQTRDCPVDQSETACNTSNVAVGCFNSFTCTNNIGCVSDEPCCLL